MSVGRDSPTVVSVIVNNFNYARFLRRAIDTALDQEYAPTQVIVVDDGSTDESAEVIASYGSRIEPILKQNGGQGSAFNAGYERARGNVIIFLDSDDELLPSAAGRTAELMGQAPGSRLYWPMRVIGRTGLETGRTTNSDLPEGDLCADALRGGPYMYRWAPTSGNAWSRSFLDAVLPVPEEAFTNYADNYLSALSPLFGAHRKCESLSLYREHRANETVTARTAPFLDRLAAWLRRFEACFDATQKHARHRALAFDSQQWKANSWFHRMDRAVTQILGKVPVNAHMALLDEDAWATGGEIAGRRVWPFLERDGTYGGHPADDGQAIAELERMFGAGVEFVVIPWTSQWWLNHYSGMAAWLESRSVELHADSDVSVLKLHSAHA